MHLYTLASMLDLRPELFLGNKHQTVLSPGAKTFQSKLDIGEISVHSYTA